jgi:hypothetical protein
MPIAFQLYSAKRFPEGNKFGTEDQLYLTIDHEQNRENVHTTVALKNAEFRDGVARYICNHDFLTKLKYPGRARNMQFEQFVTNYQFPLYLFRQADQDRPMIIISTKGPVAENFIERLNHRENFQGIERHVDFERLRALLKNIRGAWFHKMTVSNLSTTGLFGPHVDRSDEFKHAERRGKLHSLIVPHRFHDAEYVLTITERGTVVVFDTLETEEEGVDLIGDVQRKLLNRCWDM